MKIDLNSEVNYCLFKADSIVEFCFVLLILKWKSFPFFLDIYIWNIYLFNALLCCLMEMFSFGFDSNDVNNLNSLLSLILFISQYH